MERKIKQKIRTACVLPIRKSLSLFLIIRQQKRIPIIPLVISYIESLKGMNKIKINTMSFIAAGRYTRDPFWILSSTGAFSGDSMDLPPDFFYMVVHGGDRWHTATIAHGAFMLWAGFQMVHAIFLSSVRQWPFAAPKGFL
jgi:hypothetical protein